MKKGDIITKKIVDECLFQTGRTNSNIVMLSTKHSVKIVEIEKINGVNIMKPKVAID